MYEGIVLAMTIAVAFIAAPVIWLAIRRERRCAAKLERHSITPEELSRVLAQNPRFPLFDLREPLDVPANSEIIRGATKISPCKVLENPWLLPKERDIVIYCTCPDDQRSRMILERAIAMGFSRIRFLQGGLEAWKGKGFPVESNSKPFHLDVAS